jgi:hypothetical protein
MPILPPSASERLKKAAETPITPDDPMARQREIDSVTQEIRRAFPELFRVDALFLARGGSMRFIPINEHGNRIGQHHHRARYTDAEVSLAIDLYEDGFSVASVARMMEIPRTTINDYVLGRRRAQTPSEYHEKTDATTKTVRR